MEYIKETFSNGTELYIVQSDLLNTTHMEFSFYSKKDGTEGAKNLLGKLLLEGSQNYEDAQKLSLAMSKEYGASLLSHCYSERDVHALCFQIDVLTRESLAEGRDTLGNTLCVLGDIINNPRIENNKFNEDKFEMKKEETVLGIQSLKLDARAYSKERFLQTAVGKSPIILPNYGTEEEFESMENGDVVRAYELAIKTMPRKIFISTHLEKEILLEKIWPIISRLNNVDSSIIAEEAPEKKGIIRRLEEDSSFDQTMVFAGFPVTLPQEKEKKEALILLNYYLGGTANSRIFTEVRLKRDMAYYAFSSLDDDVGLIFGYSGVNIKNKDKTIDVIMNEINKVASGKITKKGFNETKKYILNSRRMSNHNMIKRLGFLETCLIKGREDRIKHYETLFSKCSYDDVVQAGKLIDTSRPIVYSLLQRRGE